MLAFEWYDPTELEALCNRAVLFLNGGLDQRPPPAAVAQWPRHRAAEREVAGPTPGRNDRPPDGGEKQKRPRARDPGTCQRSPGGQNESGALRYCAPAR